MSESFDRAAALYRPIFVEIAADSHRRELERILPYEQVEWLRQAGFGAARIPREQGGDGLTFEELFGLLVELAEADSNIAHALRGHFEFVEVWPHHARADVREFWRSRFTDHRELASCAWSERNDKAVRKPDTNLTRSADGGFVLNGAKHYSTGAIFADWIDVLAANDGGSYRVAVSTAAPGVERFDDWDGFGQILTGTGTTTFKDVPIEPLAVDQEEFAVRRSHFQMSVFQLVLLAVLVGIARRGLAEVKEYLIARKRPVFGGESSIAPRHDQLVQLDIGRISAEIFAAEAALARAAHSLDIAAEQPGPETAARSSVDTARAQATIVPAVLDATSRIFENAGVSATSAARALDRHWRNARIISSHNSLRYRERNIGVFELFGTLHPSAEEEADT